MNAILDMKWRHGSSPILAVSDAKGIVSIYSYNKKTPCLISSHQPETDNVLALSIDWSNRIDRGSCERIVVSSSNGGVKILRLRDSDIVVETKEWIAHEFEAWIAAYNNWDNNIIYTGKRDSYL